MQSHLTKVHEVFDLFWISLRFYLQAAPDLMSLMAGDFISFERNDNNVGATIQLDQGIEVC